MPKQNGEMTVFFSSSQKNN